MINSFYFICSVRNVLLIVLLNYPFSSSFFKQFCVEKCPANMYTLKKDSTECLPCHGSCLSCNERNETNCLTCPQTAAHHLGRCVKECPASKSWFNFVNVFTICVQPLAFCLIYISVLFSIYIYVLWNIPLYALCVSNLHFVEFWGIMLYIYGMWSCGALTFLVHNVPLYLETVAHHVAYTYILLDSGTPCDIYLHSVG